MTRAPTFEDIFEVMSKASVGESARVEVPEQPDLAHVPTRLAIALNLLLDDLAEQAEAAARAAKEAAEAREQRKQFEIDRLREVNQLKNRVINTSAHEFNTPLTSLVMNAQLLGSGALGSLTERQRRAVRVVERGLAQLTRLVRDMLEVARLQEGRMELRQERVDLRGILREAVESAREPAKAAGVALELAPSERLEATLDVQRIHQVLANLLANAVRATPREGRVTLETARQEDTVVVRVRDTGIGLTAEQIAGLFQPFSQVHADTQREQAGTGLGLFICRGIVEQHGGRIWAESGGPGKGSTFAFALPLAPRVAAGAAASPG